ncbi:MAG: radical SAM/SPASM domain-containing protein [Candidatus Woesearchaeota archaeon]
MNKAKTALELIRNRVLSAKKIINLLKIETSMALRSPKVWGYPYTCQIEPTNICNLKCPTCPTGCGKMTRKRGRMGFSTFKKVIDEAGDYMVQIVLMNYGEPFLNKDIYRMISYAHSKGIRTATCTNGHFIDPKKLVDSKLDYLEIALDAIDQKTLSKFRKGASFNAIVSGIKKLAREKKARKTNKPEICVQFIVNKYNEHQIGGFKDLAKGLGADKISIKSLWTNNDEDAKRFMPSDKNYNRYADAGNKNAFCKKPWSELAINCDGSVVLCCTDYNSSMVLGNVNHETVRDIINSRKYIGIRKAMLKDRTKIPLCRNCFAMKKLSSKESC